MSKNNYNVQSIPLVALCILIISFFLVCISYFYWDLPIAKFFKARNYEDYLFFRSVIRIPELLTASAFIILLGLIFNFLRQPFFTPSKKKLFAISVGLLATYTIKDILKYAFSRVDYYFFKGIFVYGAFPSGHTTIPFFVAAFLWCLMPRVRPVVFIIPTLIGISLIVTNCHLLGDVIGGVALGVISGFYAYYFLKIAKG